jgi:hypothetical protein
MHCSTPKFNATLLTESQYNQTGIRTSSNQCRMERKLRELPIGQLHMPVWWYDEKGHSTCTALHFFFGNGWVSPILTNGVSNELDQYLKSGMFHISRKVASYFNNICKPLMNMMGHHISSNVVSMLFSLHFGGNIV